MIEFKAMPKIPRLFRDVIITEKVDGTNGSIWITPKENMFPEIPANAVECGEYIIQAGSRNRFVTPGADNYGFAKWVFDNKEEIVKLGPGTHFGEWYGKGINRAYGLDNRRFALFNVQRWGAVELPSCMGVVPTLYKGEFATTIIAECMRDFAACGSRIATGYMHPEGIVVYHTAANMPFKVTFENDEKGKNNG